MSSASVSVLRADLRAVAPLVAATSGLLLAATIDGGPFATFAGVAWVVGSAAIGAAVVGHEITDRTMGALLAQPVPRTRIWAAKLVAAALALAVVAAVASSVDLLARLSTADIRLGAPALLLVAGGALCLGPAITLMSRSTLGGMAGAVAVPFVMLSLLNMSGLVEAGSPAILIWLAWSVAAVSIAGAVVGWGLFARFEDRESQGQPVHLRFGSSGLANRTPAGPIHHLVRKELHLQQLPLVVGGMYAVATLAWMFWGAPPEPEAAFAVDLRADAVVWLYAAAVAVLIGAVASADERHLGVLPAQLLLPVSLRVQFLVKIGVACAVCLALAMVLPYVLAATFAHSSAFRLDGTDEVVLWMLAMCGLTLAGLYTSSLSTSGLRAFLATPLLILALYPFMAVAVVLAGPTLLELLAPQALESPARPFRLIPYLGQGVVLLVSGSVAVVLMIFAQQNHTRPETTVGTGARQLAALVGVAALGAVVSSVALALMIRIAL